MRSLRNSCWEVLCFAVAIACSAWLPLTAKQKRADLEKLANMYEESCLASLRVINVAQGTYRGGDWAKGYAHTLKELGPSGVGYLDSATVSGEKDDYRFKFMPERTKPKRRIEHYTITARPIKRLVKDQKSFFTDETGVIRFTTENRTATKRDPPFKDTARYGPQ